MTEKKKDISGRCYCGKVSYRAAVVPEVSECHCSQCRKQSGHRYAIVETRAGQVTIEGQECITWFQSSAGAERGYCATCGSTLFWRSLEDDEMAILAASIDAPTGLQITSHIFVEDKGDYYDITDKAPQFHGYDTPVPPA
ncbi:MAG: GFA family protein [Pseudomonadota bacterium]